jgi:CRISPR/Cas system endoribonuclease Cas6 (RAMP superfamily)
MKAWYGVYEITANADMLGMILDTGMGANCMKGLGFLEGVK